MDRLVRECNALPLYWIQPTMFSDGTIMHETYEPLSPGVYMHVGLRYAREAGPTRADLNSIRADEFMAKFDALCEEYGAEFQNGSYAEDAASFWIGNTTREIA